MELIRIVAIAKVCHQANKAWCEAHGDHTQKDWECAEEWQRESAIKGVRFTIENPTATPADQHNAWMKEKIDQGWKWGEQKFVSQKIHPCLVSYENLPKFQQEKDKLFKAVVKSLW